MTIVIWPIQINNLLEVMTLPPVNYTTVQKVGPFFESYIETLEN